MSATTRPMTSKRTVMPGRYDATARAVLNESDARSDSGAAGGLEAGVEPLHGRELGVEHDRIGAGRLGLLRRVHRIGDRARDLTGARRERRPQAAVDAPQGVLYVLVDA